MIILRLFFLFSFFLLNAQTLSANNCLNYFESNKLSSRIVKNKFITNRDFSSYRKAFLDLIIILEKLSNKGGHWIDLGSGDGVALKSYFADYTNLDTRLKALGISYDMNSLSTSNYMTHQNIEFLVGRYFEDIPNTELPKADVITDYYGVLSYTKALDLVLLKTFQLLKVKGVLYIHNGPVLDFEQFTEFYFKDESMDLYQFLKLIPGIKVEFIEPGFAFGGMPSINIKITKLRSITASDIPKLELVRIEDKAPPVRRFKILSHY